MENEIEMRKLLIKTFHIEKVEFGKKTLIQNKILYLREDIKMDLIQESIDIIKCIEVKIVNPKQHDFFVNSIMDFSPIATKVLGKIGDGITHTLTGVYVMLTGIDEMGIQVAEFGSSEGILSEQVVFGRAGTPNETDIIIHVDVILKDGMGSVRIGPTAAHRACDRLVQEIRESLKKMNGKLYDEKFEYFDKIKLGKKKVVVIKQVAGQGAMYDTQLLGKEPGGFESGRSIIDLGNVPIILSPNEYRDGALRAMH
ncbi:proline reductase cluster protein PrdD [Clostridium tagluense]|uniref:PrdD protein n=1 Tax=Clostridium tagluense TaxID=360422 RepID=A0A401UGH4_9CLOT|nr:proline reductase cluster protein PrdD [Clostridium tagluense]MBU3127330.1 proline reductase cluster protein PrdD [Clostridium tagluense]MCB2297843.1 proline reductase cluster protein PrdD [Clostridium tagluense]MCB2311196.1 proline reductase cluster protein PrdD [Clostridium tagluense]MCB2315920.1 proline reductase cluster protein PrdD [Clostridium tagluense]MCB2320733.1 proline reductase cluster protein PrdD [Clostridium tagluense]